MKKQRIRNVRTFQIVLFVIDGISESFESQKCRGFLILFTNKKADFGRNLNGLNLWACWREVLAGVAIRTVFG